MTFTTYALVQDDDFLAESRLTATRLYGRLLASRIENGMTRDKVIALVGRLPDAAGGNRAAIFHAYEEYGITVWYAKRRVTRVELDPLFRPRAAKRLLSPFVPVPGGIFEGVERNKVNPPP
jgi:hypothetical protein